MTETLQASPADILEHAPAVYPYESELAQERRNWLRRFLRRDTTNQYTDEGFELDAELGKRRGPFIELGGPTESGYFHLHKRVLPRRIIVSNIRSEYMPPEYADFVERNTELVLDGTDLELPDDSMGMVVSAHIPRINPFNNAARQEELMAARTAPESALKQGYLSESLLRDSLRLKMGREVFRVLEPGGLYLMDGVLAEMAAHRLLGFEIKAHVCDTSGREEPYFYAVLQKPEPAV